MHSMVNASWVYTNWCTVLTSDKKSILLICLMFNLGIYFQILDLTKTKVLLNLGSKKFCDSSSYVNLINPFTLMIPNSLFNLEGSNFVSKKGYFIELTFHTWQPWNLEQGSMMKFFPSFLIFPNSSPSLKLKYFCLKTNVSHQFFEYKITFVKSQHKSTN